MILLSPGESSKTDRESPRTLQASAVRDARQRLCQGAAAQLLLPRLLQGDRRHQVAHVAHPADHRRQTSKRTVPISSHPGFCHPRRRRGTAHYKRPLPLTITRGQELDAQGYNCPLCKASYTPLDAATLYDPMRNLLACSICQTEVVNKENEEDIRGNKDRMQRLNRQTKGIVDLLKKMERVELPKSVPAPFFPPGPFPLTPLAAAPRFDAEAYLLVHGPALGATAAAAAEATGTGASSASVVKIHMAGDDDEANERARRERELQEKRAQNALPSWIAQSTISADPELRRAQEAAQSAEAAQEAEAGGPLSSPERAGRDGLISSSAATAGGATLRMGDDKQLAAGAGEGAEGAGAAPSGDAALDAYYASLAALEEQGTPGLDSTSSGTPAAGLGAFGAVDSPEAGSARAESEQVEPALAEEDAEDLGQSSLGGSKRERETSSPAVGELEQSKRARLSASVGTESPGAAILEEVVGTIEGSAEPVAVGEEEEEEEDEEDMDEFEAAAEGDADPNQPVMVNGKEMPFAEVTDDMTGEMVRAMFVRARSLMPGADFRPSILARRRPRTNTA